MKDVKICKSKRETSKTLLLVLLSGLGIVTVMSIVYSYLFADASPLVTSIESISKLASVAVGFYYWKAKNENLHKYKQDEKIGDIQE